MKRRIVILGSAGSIGESTLRIVRDQPDAFDVVGLAVRCNVARVLEQAGEFGVAHVAVADSAAAGRCRELAPPGVTVLSGAAGVEEAASLDGVDVVVGAIVGMAGLRPVLAAIRRGRDIALATKEVLVSAGRVVTEACRQSGSRLLPVDSEPNAIFQCLAGRPAAGAARLILTASGGPFADRPDVDFDTVGVDQALNHPRWNMGRKVTIDSATLMNKGLEVMETHWLFEMPLDRIDVVVHPESIVHSMVEFVDGSVLAQMSLPDMRFAIQYALTHPDRLPGDLPELDLMKLGALHFRKPDVDRFPCLALARAAGTTGGTLPAVLNAANEVAVNAFLAERIPFSGIWRIVEQTMEKHRVIVEPGLDDIVEADAWARRVAGESA